MGVFFILGILFRWFVCVFWIDILVFCILFWDVSIIDVDGIIFWLIVGLEGLFWGWCLMVIVGVGMLWDVIIGVWSDDCDDKLFIWVVCLFDVDGWMVILGGVCNKDWRVWVIVFWFWGFIWSDGWVDVDFCWLVCVWFCLCCVVLVLVKEFNVLISFVGIVCFCNICFNW